MVETVVLTVVLLWLAPLATIAVPGVAFSRDSVVVVMACVARIPDALAIIREERERTVAEKDAFERFAARVSDIDAAAPGQTTSDAAVLLATDGTATSTGAVAGLDDVRTAYRETVMAVAHYAEEYDESLAENMAAEFGADVATAVGGGDALTPQLQAALVQASIAARQERASFLRTLDREIDALTDARRRLRGLSETTERLARTPLGQRSFDEVLGVERRLCELEEDCERVLGERQRHLQERCTNGGVRLQEYLHASRTWTFPVLADAVELVSRVRDVERRVVRTVTRRR